MIIEQRHPSWLLIRIKMRLVKESKLIEKLRSQHQQTMRFSLVTRQHHACYLPLGDHPRGQPGEKKSGQCMARPCHGGLIKKLPITCLSKIFIFRVQHRGAALRDNTAPKIFHVKWQTQHVRHTIPYRLYHHYLITIPTYTI